MEYVLTYIDTRSCPLVIGSIRTDVDNRSEQGLCVFNWSPQYPVCKYMIASLNSPKSADWFCSTQRKTTDINKSFSFRPQNLLQLQKKGQKKSLVCFAPALFCKDPPQKNTCKPVYISSSLNTTTLINSPLWARGVVQLSEEIHPPVNLREAQKSQLTESFILQPWKLEQPQKTYSVMRQTKKLLFTKQLTISFWRPLRSWILATPLNI